MTGERKRGNTASCSTILRELLWFLAIEQADIMVGSYRIGRYSGQRAMFQQFQNYFGSLGGRALGVTAIQWLYCGMMSFQYSALVGSIGASIFICLVLLPFMCYEGELSQCQIDQLLLDLAADDKAKGLSINGDLLLEPRKVTDSIGWIASSCLFHILPFIRRRNRCITFQ